MKWLKRFIIFFIFVYLLPTGASAIWWYFKDRPTSFRTAYWGESGLLPIAQKSDAAFYVLAARTGGMKGAVSVHSWLVFKKNGANQYERYEVVGWGKALRHNAYPPDAYWYSNYPFIVKEIHGEKAEDIIKKVEKIIVSYPYGGQNQYEVWPGPNSNTFVATVLRQVPEIDAVLQPNAVGRDYLIDKHFFEIDSDKKDYHFNLYGYFGVNIGIKSGVELNIATLVAGFDFYPFALKIPAIGRVGF